MLDRVERKILDYVGNLRISDIVNAKDADIIEVVLGLRISSVECLTVDNWMAIKRVLEASSDTCLTLRETSIKIIDDIIEGM